MIPIRNTIPKKAFEFILEQHNNGVKHKHIVKMVKKNFDFGLTVKQVGQLITDYELGTDEAPYEVK